MQETITIPTPEQIEVEFELAGPGSRFTAYVIDLLCIVLLFLTLVAVFLVGTGVGHLVPFDQEGLTGKQLSAWAVAFILVLFFLVQWGYFVGIEWWMRGQSPGKKALGIRVVRDDGLPVSLREATLRNLVRVADMLPPPSYVLGGIVMYFDRSGRRLGDMVAGTVVVRQRYDIEAGLASHTDWGATWLARLEQGKSGTLTLPHGTIGAQQLALIAQFLQRRHTLPPERRRQLAARILAPLRPMLDTDRHGQDDQPERLLLEILQQARQTAVDGLPGGAEKASEQTKREQWHHFARQAVWLLRDQRRGLRRLGAEGLQRFMDDYRRITTDLARGRSLGADTQTLDLLNRLVVMGYSVLYGYTRVRRGVSLRPWFGRFPRLVRQHRRAMLLAAGMLFIPACISAAALVWHPELSYDLVAEGFLEFSTSDPEHLHDLPSLTRPIAASTIITNNLQVTLMAFGLGLTAGIGTCFVLLYNGVHLGAVIGWLTLQGHSRALWGWIMPHGGTELLAIVLSGGAGLMLASALLVPGDVSRITALKRMAPLALQIELGCMLMLLIAGLIEGFVSPSSIGYAARLGVFVLSLSLWSVYFVWAGRASAARPRRPTQRKSAQLRAAMNSAQRL
jgi:uncharacterized membrane protein SpoIIM required for sporulation/uncharacterized RDD family membrane protein YckC